MAISQTKRTRKNEEITAAEVRVLSPDKEQLGVMSLKEAMALARKERLDLVEIVPNAKPPVCHIVDFGRYRFEQQKSTAQKKQKPMQVKEVKFRPNIEEQDYQVKLRNLIRFLTAGNRVKITIRYRGREMAHQELGMRIIERLLQDLDAHGVVEQKPKMEDRQLLAVLAPKKDG